MTTGQESADSVSRLRLVSRRRTVVQTFGTVAVALALLLGFGLTANLFLSADNIRNIFIQICVVGVVAIGETIVMLLGGIDLSVGAIALLSEVLVGDLTTSGHSVVVALLVALAAAGGVGLLNGLLIAISGIEPILATLATLFVTAGLAKLILGLRYLELTNSIFDKLATQNIVFNLPGMVVIMLGCYVVAAVVMQHTPFGRSVYAVGGNRRAARLSGLSVPRVTIAAYTVTGLLCGIAGFLSAAQLGLVSQGDLASINFQAIIIVLIGGLSVSRGGVGRMERTLIGALIVGMIINYQTIKGINPAFQQALLGGLVLVTVLADRALRGRDG